MGAQPPKMEAQWRETEKSVIFNIFGEPTVIQLCSSLKKRKKKKKVFFQAIFIFFSERWGFIEGPVRQPQV